MVAILIRDRFQSFTGKRTASVANSKAQPETTATAMARRDRATSDVAHVVLTNTRLLSRNDPSDHEGVELIRAAAERGVNLTAQLLNLTGRLSG